MRAGVAAIVLFLSLAASADARLTARLTGDRSVAVRVTGVTHVKRVVVRWGDGRQTAKRRHRYAAPGRYTIRARILRRGHRHPRTARTRLLVPGPVAAHHVEGYLVSDRLDCGAVSLEAGPETRGCATSLTVDGVRYGSADYVPVTSYQTGSGTAADPFVLTRVVRAGGRIELVQASRVVAGSETAALETYALRSVDGAQHVVVLDRTVTCAKRGARAVTKTSVTCRAPGAPVSSALTLADLGAGGVPGPGPGIGLSWRVTVPALSAASVTESSQLRLSAG